MHGPIAKMAMAWILVGACAAAAGCSGDTDPTDGCLTTLPTACPTPPVKYANVQPIFQARCVNMCHNGATLDPETKMPIWGLTDYSHVSTWQDTIRAKTASCEMPPPDAGVPMTMEERRAILEWVHCGVPE